MPGHLAPGHRAAGRYRLQAQLGRGPRTVVWRALDENLGRQVALRFFDPELDRALLAERAARAASLTSPRVQRIFDTGFDGGQLFCVSELLPGSLAWVRSPLAPEEAVRLGLQVAEALAYAHQRGIAHGALHPGNVLLGEQGAKVADFALSAASLERTGAGPTPAEDLVQLGNLLYGALTGRDPRSGPAASRPLPDEPRGLARVVAALREGAYRDARRAAEDLRALLPAPPRRERRRLLPVAAAAVGVPALLAAVATTRLGGRAPTTPTPTEPPTVSGRALPVAGVEDFDPLGDGREGHRTVRFVADGNTRTFWSTERYRSSAAFSGRKPGVGVVLDLGQRRAVGAARVILAAPGCWFELRASDTRPSDPGQWQRVGAVRAAGHTSVLQFAPRRARRWLLWVTRLTRGVPGAGGSFACGVAEVALFPP